MAIKGFVKNISRNSGISADIRNRGNELSYKSAALNIKDLFFHEDNDYRDFECDDESIDQLARSIEHEGFTGSITVVHRPGGLNPDLSLSRTDGYVILSGERRVRALRKLCSESSDKAVRFSTVPCSVLTGLSSDPAISHAQEMVILDGCNMLSRGGLKNIGGPEYRIKVVNRYIENLRKAENLSEEEARLRVRAEAGDQADKLLRNDWLIKDHLSAFLYELFTQGKSSTGLSYLFFQTVSRLPEKGMSAVENALTQLSSLYSGDALRDVNRIFARKFLDVLDHLDAEVSADAVAGFCRDIVEPLKAVADEKPAPSDSGDSNAFARVCKKYERFLSRAEKALNDISGGSADFDLNISTLKAMDIGREEGSRVVDRIRGMKERIDLLYEAMLCDEN